MKKEEIIDFDAETLGQDREEVDDDRVDEERRQMIQKPSMWSKVKNASLIVWGVVHDHWKGALVLTGIAIGSLVAYALMGEDEVEEKPEEDLVTLDEEGNPVEEASNDT